MSDKIVKWELFFVFDDGSRESMWEINRIKGKNLRDIELLHIDDYKRNKKDHGNEHPFVMQVTYADGVVGEI